MEPRCVRIPRVQPKAVGCPRVCRERRAGQGETKQRTPVRNEEQRRQDRRARCNRVHSAVTYKVKMNEGRKVNIHAALEMFTSGQLLFLGKRRFIRVDARRSNWDGLQGGFCSKYRDICKKTNAADRPSQVIARHAE